MKLLNKPAETVNQLLDKVENMPEQVADGKTPVLETGTTTTLEPQQQATSEVVPNGTDESGNPKYQINLGIPRGADGTSSGGGGVADSVDWSEVNNKPQWVDSDTKPEYTADEVGALPSDTTFKTINGESIKGEGDIEITGGSGGGISDAPSDGFNYTRKNGAWEKQSVLSIYSINYIPAEHLASSVSNISIDSSKITELMANAEGIRLGGVGFILSSGGAVTASCIRIRLTTDGISITCVVSANEEQDIDADRIVTIDFNSTTNTYSTYVKVISEGGSGGSESGSWVYDLNPSILMLTNESSSADISAAVGGLSGFEAIKQAAKDGKTGRCTVDGNALLNFALSSMEATNYSYLFVIGLAGILTDPQNQMGFYMIEYNKQNGNFSFYIQLYQNSSSGSSGSSTSTYTIPEAVISLGDAPTSEEVSNAIGGLDGLKKAISAVENGSTILFGSTGMTGQVHAACINMPESNMYGLTFTSMLLVKSLSMVTISCMGGNFSMEKKTLVE